VVDDVIVLLEPARHPASLRIRQAASSPESESPSPFAADIQRSFSGEWQEFPDLFPENEPEFDSYFDLVDLGGLAGARVCDLGCGNGRWSHYLSRHCRELVLVDFSDAIFVARRNLAGNDRAVFFLADLTALPFRPDFADLIVCLGVLHHLPSDALEALRRLAPLARRHLVYLYYALDNRAAHYRALLRGVTGLRLLASRLPGQRARSAVAWLALFTLYLPLIGLGSALRPFGLSQQVPLYDSYRGKSPRRIRQDVYDRLFTRIEQRFTRRQIETLSDTFSQVAVSPNWPYWHFLCTR
jgi:SAM-dependent methyltransferase